MADFQLNIDCEGPLTQNDNAFELCQEFIPSGGAFFSIVSKYDDFLADVVHKPGYKAGDTLRLVLPFLKAFDVTHEMMERFSEKTLLLLPGTEIMLPKLNGLLSSFIISTSYRPYIEALCNLTSFPMEHCYCTSVDLDQYSIEERERKQLRKLAKEIAQLEMLNWADDAKTIEDLDKRHQETIKRLDEIFWKIIPSMSIGKILEDVNPVGGIEKAKAVEDSIKRTGLELNRVIYAGDSITDWQALDLVRGAGGVAISFNGNRYAIKSAEYAIISSNTCIIYGICSLILNGGREIFQKVSIDKKGKFDLQELLEKMDKISLEEEIFKQIYDSAQKEELEIYHIERSDMEKLCSVSEKVRKEVRGHRIGELG